MLFLAPFAAVNPAFRDPSVRIIPSRTATEDTNVPIGFTSQSWRLEKEREAKFDQSISSKDQLEWMRHLTLYPHNLGSEYQRQNSEYLLGLYKSWGFDAEIKSYEALFPTPITRLVSIGNWQAQLAEPPVPGDSGSAHPDQELPVYNAYSPDGDVTAPVVYVNYGTKADYTVLERHGISVKGKIVLTRYGGIFRGIKPKIAAEHGAIGCLIFTDPKDDGYGKGAAYPDGAWRSAESAQRGSVLDGGYYDGDPLSPGYASVPGAPRLPISEAKPIAKIPTQPLAYGDAQPILASLGGEVVPNAWKGGLPLTYRYGPSKEPLHLKLKFNWQTVQIHDVIAKMKGTEFPDQWVLRGNHYDAWVCGANDPISGQVAMLSEAKAVGELAKAGMRPKRTMIFCSWDGEEEGLFGSTEWAEDNATELIDKAVAYVNSDTNGMGYPGGSGMANLNPLVQSVLEDVIDPHSHVSVLKRWRANQEVSGSKERNFTLGPPGAGSDDGTFGQHLTVPTIDLGYGGEGEGTQYHSAYDSFEWYTKYGDPGLVYGAVLSKTTGRLVLRMANADILPMRFVPVADAAKKILSEVQELLVKERTDAETINQELKDGAFTLTNNPYHPTVPPPHEEDVPFLNWAPLEAAVHNLAPAAEKFDASASATNRWNDAALKAYRNMMGPGLPGRPWCKDIFEAAGKYSLYDSKTFPGVREAIELKQWKEAQEQIEVTAAQLTKLAKFLNDNS